MRAFKTLATVLIVAAIAGYTGYILGVKRTEYLYSRYQISNLLWAQATVDSGDIEKFRSGSDTFIRGAYLFIKTQPALIAWFSPDRKRDPETRIKQVAESLKASLDRNSSAPPTEEEVEQFVRTYMGTHSTTRVSHATIDALNQQKEGQER